MNLSDSFRKTFLIEFMSIFKDREIFKMLMIGPLLYGILLPAVYFQERVQKVPIGLVNLDNSFISREILKTIKATEGVNIENNYLNLHEAKKALQQHEIDAIIYFPKDFNKFYKQKSGASLSLFVNSSNLLVANPVLSSISSVIQNYSEEEFKKYLQSKNLSSSKALALSHPIYLDLRNIYNPSLSYSYFMIPGLIFAILQQVLLLGFCMVIGKRPKDFILKVSKDFFAHFLPYPLLITLFSLIFVTLMLPFFHIPFFIEKFPSLLLLSFFFSMATASCSLLISSFSKDRINILIALMFYSIPALFLSGYSWPSQYLPLDLKILSQIFPITHFLPEMRKIILGDVALTSFFSCLLNLFLFTSICLILHSFIYKYLKSNKIPANSP